MVEISQPAAPWRGVLKNIQALRAVAAVMVVFVHLNELGVAAGGREGLFEAGNAGVDLFFVISGLIMVLTTWDRPTSPAAFFLNRIKRIVPLYWIITALVFAIAVAAPHLMQATRADPVELLKSLLFIPFAKANGLTQPVAFVGWTLNYEMAFYVVFALALFSRNPWIRLAAPTAVIVGAAVWGLVAHPQGTVLRFYTSPMIVEFVLGMWLARWFVAAGPAARNTGLAAAGLVAGFAVMLAAPWIWPGAERAVVYGLPALLIVFCALVLERNGRTASAPWVQLIGNASYSIYLTHFFVTQAATKVYEMIGPSRPLALLMIPAALAGVLVTGVLVHMWIERPLSRTLDRRRKEKEAARA